MKKIIILLLLCSGFTSSAQDTTDYFNPGFLRYENHIYKPSIHTVILERNNEMVSDPIIVLNSEQQLHLQFDDLTDEPTLF